MSVIRRRLQSNSSAVDNFSHSDLTMVRSLPKCQCQDDGTWTVTPTIPRKDMFFPLRLVMKVVDTGYDYYLAVRT